MESESDDSIPIEINTPESVDASSPDTNVCPLLITNPTTIDIDERGDLDLVVGTNKCEIINGHHEHQKAMRFRVCSRTLARWSPVMKAMLFGRFRESTQAVVALPDDNPEIMKVLLDIAHGDFKAIFELDKKHSHTSFRHLLADDVYSIVALANKYIMTRALCPWASKLIPRLLPTDEHSEEYCSIKDFRRLEKALFIACEFGHFKLFKGASIRLVWLLRRNQELFSSCIEPFPSYSSGSSDKSDGTIGETHIIKSTRTHANMGLPGHIRHLRLQLIENILSPLRRLISALKDGNDPTGSYCCNADSDHTRKQCNINNLGVLWLFLDRESLNPLPDSASVLDCPRDLHTRLILHTMFPGQGLWSDCGPSHQGCQVREIVTTELLSAPTMGFSFYSPPEAMKKAMLKRAKEFDFPRPK
jgi:hypothetical protein